MNVSVELTRDLLKYMDGKVGREYKSRSEAVRDAIRLMIREDLRRQARLKDVTKERLSETRDHVAEELLRGKYRTYA